MVTELAARDKRFSRLPMIDTKQTLEDIRDKLLKENEYKTQHEKMSYIMGVLDMYNEAKKQ